LAEVIEDEKSKKWHWIRKCKVFVLTSICIGLTFLLLFLPEAIANYNLVTGYSLPDKHILTLIDPKYNDCFCQIYTNCSEIQNLQTLMFRISEQFV
jgi:hypothetical protein